MKAGDTFKCAVIIEDRPCRQTHTLEAGEEVHPTWDYAKGKLFFHCHGSSYIFNEALHVLHIHQDHDDPFPPGYGDLKKGPLDAA